MSPNKLASQLLQYSSTTSLLLPGALTAALGGEAVQDALNRNWVRPDLETGYLALTDQQSLLNEMRELARAEKKEAPAPQPVVESPSRRFAMAHSTRLTDALGTGLSGSSVDTMGVDPRSIRGGAYAGGQPPRAAVTPTTPPDRRENFMVGEDVVVADEGKSYQAKVKATNPDGTYSLTFGPNRPVKQDRMFRREEMQRIQPGREGTIKVQQ